VIFSDLSKTTLTGALEAVIRYSTSGAKSSLYFNGTNRKKGCMQIWREILKEMCI
jgi:hypothetical protein